MVINLQRHLISYDGRTKQFVTEASNLSRGNFLHRLYPDACDEGVTLYNPATNVSVDFYMYQSETSSEGELLSWYLLPTPESLRKVPKLNGVSILIFND